MIPIILPACMLLCLTETAAGTVDRWRSNVPEPLVSDTYDLSNSKSANSVLTKSLSVKLVSANLVSGYTLYHT